MKQMERAEQGRQYWMDNELDQYEDILLLPHTDEALADVMLVAFEAMLSDKGGTKAAVLSRVKTDARDMYDIFSISGKQTENLLALYTLYEFTDKLIIGSFDLPYGRKLTNLLDCHIADTDKLALAAIFGL